jgi:hypothetical protein
MNKELDKSSELYHFGTLLNEAIAAGMEIEVVYSALQHMKENQYLNPLQALMFGYDEWIK